MKKVFEVLSILALAVAIFYSLFLQAYLYFTTGVAFNKGAYMLLAIFIVIAIICYLGFREGK